jgi:hypothetical protein
MHVFSILTKRLSHTMHRKDLNDKNNVYNNTKSYINNTPIQQKINAARKRGLIALDA